MVKEIDPLCVLDFYVSEACQRQGIGSRLFEVMLEVTSNRERVVSCVGVLYHAFLHRAACVIHCVPCVVWLFHCAWMCRAWMCLRVVVVLTPCHLVPCVAA